MNIGTQKHYLLFLLLFQETESPSKNKAEHRKDNYFFVVVVVLFSCGFSTENVISPKALYLSGEEFREFTWFILWPLGKFKDLHLGERIRVKEVRRF